MVETKEKYHVETCDKCESTIRDTKYPWYSYYSPKGEATTILFRYCDESKKEIQKLYAIPEDFFGKASNDVEELENKIQYSESRKEAMK